ncbi:uncharacterized protein SCHCODRAFT_01057211, partial [Schizophyllum commune H4-8]|uniref:uncharacterized protein n=1 Tax=Schizophyllum commune (strain H4-8 / FGSC 9210) TaxID=578458 RepID=UPI00215F2230
LYLLQRILLEGGKSLPDFPDMPVPQRDWGAYSDNPYIAEQLTQYDPDVESEQAHQLIALMNADQRTAFDAIIASVNARDGQLFFLNGPGGTGKTFIYKALCHCLRAESSIVLCVASSGIAALLLPGGRTSHSTFRIPIDNLTDASSCSISKQSLRADMLRMVRLIV